MPGRVDIVPHDRPLLPIAGVPNRLSYDAALPDAARPPPEERTAPDRCPSPGRADLVFCARRSGVCPGWPRRALVDTVTLSWFCVLAASSQERSP